MKNVKCLFNHRFIKINECIKENFENDDKAITIYRCKYCDKVLWVRDRYIKGHFKNPSTED